MKDRSATKRCDCRKIVCANSSAVVGTAIRSAHIAHTSRLVCVFSKVELDKQAKLPNASDKELGTEFPEYVPLPGCRPC